MNDQDGHAFKIRYNHRDDEDLMDAEDSTLFDTAPTSPLALLDKDETLIPLDQ